MSVATSAPTVFDASHASRRSAGSSLWRRMRLISVSSTSTPAHDPAMPREAQVDRRTRARRSAREGRRELLREHEVVQQVEASADVAVGRRTRAQRRRPRRAGDRQARPTRRARRGSSRRRSRSVAATCDSHQARFDPRERGASRASASSRIAGASLIGARSYPGLPNRCFGRSSRSPPPQACR